MLNGKKYNFCIVTYETFPNPNSQNLKTFLLENLTSDILYIYHPMLDMPQGYNMSSGYDYFEDNKLLVSQKAYQWKLYWPLLYIKDILYTLFCCIKQGKRFDIYFAFGNLNPIAGIILRSFGIVKKVVYHTSDYYPQRFKSNFFNWLYYQLDKFCVKACDETWNVSPAIAEAREKRMHMKGKDFSRQHTVRGGIWFLKTKRLPFSKINNKKMVYRGMLFDYMGIDLAIKAMPLILKKIPNLKFEIIGTGKEEKNLKKLARGLGVSGNVIFHGFVEGREQMEKIISDAALGIATFNTGMIDDKVKNSDPGKLKDYMLLGLPVVTTDAFFESKKIAEMKCGLVIPYDHTELANAVIRLISNKKELEKYRENAIKFIEEFDCAKILKPNVQRVLNSK